MDQLGDFQRALELAADLGQTRPRPVWLRPRRSMSDRMLNRTSSPARGMTALAAPLPRLLAGGIYYLEPSCLLGGDLDWGD